MTQAVLALNAGSSSLKFALFRHDNAAGLLLSCKGEIEGIGAAPSFSARGANGTLLENRLWPPEAAIDQGALFVFLREWIESYLGSDSLIAVGHRVVHGGDRFRNPVLVNDEALAVLTTFNPLAPLHQPHNLAAIRAMAKAHPGIPQIACFDTAFHSNWSATVKRFALPAAVEDVGIRRYGFHGLSYEYIARRLAEIAPQKVAGRIVAAHLGSGASLCAMRAGNSIDSTMGFSTLDGLPMATRCGALDPGAVLFLLRQPGMNADRIEELLYHQAGLLGLSGISGDMRILLESADPRAQAAIDFFVFRVVRELGAMAAVLGGLDGLVFTAGIGEHAPAVRQAVCENAAWLGIRLDADANRSSALTISDSRSAVPVWVIPTDEERMIATHSLAVVQGRVLP